MKILYRLAIYNIIIRNLYDYDIIIIMIILISNICYSSHIFIAYYSIPNIIEYCIQSIFHIYIYSYICGDIYVYFILNLFSCRGKRSRKGISTHETLRWVFGEGWRVTMGRTAEGRSAPVAVKQSPSWNRSADPHTWTSALQ